MGRIRSLSGADVYLVLSARGFIEVRCRESHVVMQKRTAGSTITVPVPIHAQLKRGTLALVIRQSGLPRALFEE